MARGKYAIRSAHYREHILEEEVRSLTQKLSDEKAARRDEALRHAEELRSIQAEVARRSAEHVQRILADRVDEVSNGLTASVWRAERLAMTRHLSWLFFKGYLNWDRLRGDLEVLTFISTHGDLDAWFQLADKWGWMASRKELRKPSKKNHGKRAFLEITDTIEKALGMAGPPVERAIAARTELDGMVNAARDAFVAVKAEEWFPDEEVNEAPTAEQIAMHSEVMDSLEEYFSRAPGRQVPR